MTASSVRHASFTIDKIYNAPPARVYEAWTNPESYMRWFVGGEEWEVAEHKSDFRVGGIEHSRFRPKGGTKFITNDQRYEDIVPNERLIFAYAMSLDGVRFSASLTTVEFMPEGKGTKLVLTEQMVMLNPEDKVENRETGWKAGLVKLGIEVSRLAAA
jgi:uncharacterized protein YndB with AHSA1/START domain